MTPASSTTRALVLALLASWGLALAALPARAQGTPEQQQACAPDAIRLCQDTIPDVGRTTACMRAHRAELSPQCKVAFDAAAPPAPAPRSHVARAKPAPRPTPVREAARPPMPSRHHAVATRGDRDTREAHRVVGRLCGGKLIDPGTCGFINQMITLSE